MLFNQYFKNYKKIQIYSHFVVYSNNIGPGEYKVRSEFDLNKYIKEMDERGTYLTIDNGHLN